MHEVNVSTEDAGQIQSKLAYKFLKNITWKNTRCKKARLLFSCMKAFLNF